MPTYIVDATVSDRNTVMRPVALGWEELDIWQTGGTVFRRQRTVIEAASLAAVFAELVEMASRTYGDPIPPVTVSLAIRDVSFSLEESLPYRYRPTTRRRRS